MLEMLPFNYVTASTLFSVLLLKEQFSLSVVLFNNPDSFGVSCLVLEILAVEISTFSLIQWG